MDEGRAKQRSLTRKSQNRGNCKLPERKNFTYEGAGIGIASDI